MDVDVAGMLFAMNPLFAMDEFHTAQNLCPLMPYFTMDHIRAYEHITNPATLNIAGPTVSQIEAAAKLINIGLNAFTADELTIAQNLYALVPAFTMNQLHMATHLASLGLSLNAFTADELAVAHELYVTNNAFTAADLANKLTEKK